MATEQHAQRNPGTAQLGAGAPRDAPIKPPIPKNRVFEMRMYRSENGVSMARF